MGEASKVLIPIFGLLDVTGEVVAEWIILLGLLVFSVLASGRLKERPGKFQNVVETGIETLDNFLSDLLGRELSEKYYYFLGSLFIFIIAANYSGLIPGVGLTDYVKAPTSSLSVTAGLGICSFVFLQAAGIRAGIKGYFKRFVSPMFFMLPLILLDEFVKPVSLSLRLFGNVYGEEMVTEQLYEILPIGAPLIMMGLSLLFCAIQAIVFTMLVSIYLSEMLETDED